MSNPNGPEPHVGELAARPGVPLIWVVDETDEQSRNPMVAVLVLTLGFAALSGVVLTIVGFTTTELLPLGVAVLTISLAAGVAFGWWRKSAGERGLRVYFLTETGAGSVRPQYSTSVLTGETPSGRANQRMANELDPTGSWTLFTAWNRVTEVRQVRSEVSLWLHVSPETAVRLRYLPSNETEVTKFVAQQVAAPWRAR